MARSTALAGVTVVRYWLARVTLLARFVPLRVAYALAVLVAEVLWLGWPAKRQAAIENLSVVLGNRQAARPVARRSFHNYGRYLVDFIRGGKIGPDEIHEKVCFDRWDGIEAAMAEGRGAIIALMHFGNWEMGGPFLAQRGYGVNVIAQSFSHPGLNKLVVSSRRVRGMNVIPAERPALAVIRALRRNEILGIHLDTPQEDGGVLVPFFGRPAWVPAGPARLALRTGARVIPAALVRASDAADHTIALIDFDVRATHTGDLERDVRDLTRRILEAHERFIRAYPDQWFMFRPLWPPRLKPDTAGTAPAFAAEG